MKSNILSLLVFTAILTYTTTAQAQVGIGTNSPGASAQLEVTSTSKGFLPPRVTLQGTDDATKGTPTIVSPATGLLVYNSASAGSGATAVTPGFYYYDGAKWQRIINQQPDATIEFNTADPNSISPSPTFTPSTPASKDYVYVSSVDNSQWTWNGTAYVTYTPPASTAWYLSGGTKDAGSNKTGSVYRTGKVGIGAASASSTLSVGSSNGSVPGDITINPSDGANEGGQINIKKSPNSGAGSDWTIDQIGTSVSDARFRIFSSAESKGITILDNGNVGIGSLSPSTKLEINAGVSNTSGVKFSNLNSSTPVSSGATLGVDANGNVVTVQGSSFSPSFGSAAPSGTITVNAGSSSLLKSISLPTTGTYLINYTMRVQSTGATTNQYAVGYLSNTSTPGSPISGTEILGAYSGSAFVTGGNYSGSYIVTVTSAPQSLHFIGSAQTGQMSFLDDLNGRTRISYVKVTP
jgi:hypothetical protein